MGETLQWIFWHCINKQAGGPKHPASFSSIYLPDALVIRYKSLLKDVQKRSVNTSLKHTLMHARAVKNSIPLWRGEKERVTGDGGATETERVRNKRKAGECLCISRRPGAAQFLPLSSRGSDHQQGRVSGWRALPFVMFNEHLNASSKRTSDLLLYLAARGSQTDSHLFYTRKDTVWGLLSAARISFLPNPLNSQDTTVNWCFSFCLSSKMIAWAMSQCCILQTSLRSCRCRGYFWKISTGNAQAQ